MWSGVFADSLHGIVAEHRATAAFDICSLRIREGAPQGASTLVVRLFKRFFNDDFFSLATPLRLFLAQVFKRPCMYASGPLVENSLRPRLLSCRTRHWLSEWRLRCTSSRVRNPNSRSCREYPSA